MTQCHARISRENLPVPLKLENIIIRLPLWIGLKYGDSFEHWLVMYFLKYWFGIIFNQKKYADCRFKFHWFGEFYKIKYIYIYLY